MKIFLFDFKSTYLYLLYLLLSTIFPLFTCSFVLKINLQVSEQVNQIDITNTDGSQQTEPITNSNSLNHELSNIDYGNIITILTTSSSTSVSFCGYIEIDKYLFYTNNTSIWMDNIDTTSNILSNCICAESSVNGASIRIQIPVDENNLQSNADEIANSYTCQSKDYKIILGSDFSFDITSLILPENYNGQLSITIPSSIKGTFTYKNNTSIPTSASFITEETEFVYKTFVSQNGDPVLTYTETITYYTYTNKIYTQLCEEGTITFTICGTGCQDCELDSSTNNYYCISCITDFYFMEYNIQYCKPLSSKPSNYYIKDNKYFLPCYSKCATCDTAQVDDYNQKCTSCLNTHPYSLYNTTDLTYNCYYNCNEANAYQVENTYQCIPTCTGTSTPNDYNGLQCFNTCPHYVISSLHKCVDSCADETIYKYISADGKECVDKCNNNIDYPFISEDGSRCVQECSNYKLNNIQCVDACNDDYPYVDESNKNCMTSCGSLYEINDTKECVSACPTDQNLYKIQLQSGEKKCVSSCLNNSPFLNLEDKECVLSCPTDKSYYLSTTLQCVESCTDSYKYFHGYVCYDKCPDTFPYILGYSNECILNCQEEGLNYINIDSTGKHCVENCNATQVILENKTCETDCTIEYPFYYLPTRTCYSKCPSYLYELSIPNQRKECVDNCANLVYSYEYESSDEKKCTDTCDNDLKYLDKDNKKCVAVCPFDKSKYLPTTRICVSTCSGDYPYDFNNMCVETCPNEAPFISEDLKTCVSTCPHKVSSNGKNCVVECDATDLVTLGNKTCAPSCIDEYMYYYSKNATCLIDCEYNGLKYYKNEKKCVDECDSTYPYILTSSNKCTDNCKEEGKFLYNDACIDNCYNNYKILPPDNKCVSTCEGDYEYLNFDTSTCVKECKDSYSYYISNNKTCYTSCQDPFKYVKEGEFECLKKCPSDTYIYNGHICVTSCFNDTMNLFYYNNTCVTTCGEVDAYQIGNLPKCVDECNDLYVEGEAKCVTVCEGETKYQYGNRCLRNCPTNAPYIMPISNKCVNKCNEEPYTYINTDNNHCMLSCGGEVQYIVNNTDLKCYKQCPIDFPYKIEGSTNCIASCKEIQKYLLDNETCVSSCPSGTKISQSNMNCVSSCESINQYEDGDGVTCVEQCSDQFPYIIEGTNKCINLCPFDTPYLYGNVCVQACPTGYQSIIPSNKTCLSSCPSDLPYKNINSNDCRESCNEIDAEYLDYDNNLCISQCEENQFEITDIKQCHNSNCPSKYPFKINYPSFKRCVQKCDYSDYVYTDYVNKECLRTCSDTHYSSILEYGDQCLETCPLFTKPQDRLCVLDMHVISENEDYIVTEMKRDAMIDRININVIDLINLNKTIKGNDYLLQIYPSSLPIKSNNETSSMIFNECESILKQENGIDIDNDIIIAKFDYVDSTSISNQIQYKVYDMNGDELDLTSCKNTSIDLMYPINSPNTINLNEAYALSKKGIDIYNINDTFFNDICYPYISNGYDVSLNERIMNYYSNVSFCEDNCVYMYLNYTQNKAKCNCKVKHIFDKNNINNFNGYNSSKEHLLKGNEYNDKFDIIKCYNLLTEWKYIKNNLSLWLFGVANIANIVYVFVNITFEIKHLYTSLNKICKGNPPKHLNTEEQHNNINIENINTNNNINPRHVETSLNHQHLHNEITQLNEDKHQEIERAFDNNDNVDLSHDRMVKKSKRSSSVTCDLNLNDTWMSHSDNKSDRPKKQKHPTIIKHKDINTHMIYISNTSKRLNAKEIEIDLSTFTPLITTQHLNNLPYFIAYQLDKRSFCSIYFSLFRQRHLLLRACFRISPFDVPSLNIMLFILYIIMLFMCNALLYKKNEFVLSLNEDDSYLNQLKLKWACLYGFVSVLICGVVIGVIKRMVNFEKKYKVIIVEMGNDEYTQAKMIKKILLRFQIMFGVCIGIDMCLYLMFWYYLSVFNVVYKGNMYKWFIWGCFSLMYTFGISVVFCFVVTGIRVIGIKWYSKTFYNIALFLQSVYLL